MSRIEGGHNKVLVIGWDAADWRVITPLLDQGKMPNLQRMIEQGVKGNLATLYPVLSPMLWTSIATGKRAWKHGIYGFTEPDPNTGGIRPITHLSRRTKTIWNILNQVGKRSNVVGWWPSHPAEPVNGVMVSNQFQQAVAPVNEEWPMRPGTVYPTRLQEILKDYRIHPRELEGDDLIPFVPEAAKIDQKKDARLWSIAKTIAECSGIHVAATGIMQLEPWDFMAIYYDAIDHFAHGFMRYHPPKQEWVSEEDFRIYHKVIEGAYIFHDLMLGTLLELAGETTNVLLISDHGFHPDHLRPRHLPNEPAGPAAEHRNYGILVAQGPQIKKDQLIFGATLLDIVPTVLTFFDLPLGEDLDGKPLLDLLSDPPESRTIPSWDEVPGQDGRHPPNMRVDSADSEAMLRQLVDLGYVDEPDDELGQAVAETTRELRYNLAQAYIGGNRFAEAANVLNELWDAWPEESRFGVKLLTCYIAYEKADEARETLEILKTRKARYAEAARLELKVWNDKWPEDSKHEPTRAEQQRYRSLRSRANVHVEAFCFFEAQTLFLEGKLEESLEQLDLAMNTQTHLLPSIHCKRGECLRVLGRWQEAQTAFEAALQIDEENAHAWVGVCRCHLQGKRNLLAASAAQKSIGLQFFNPNAHYHFGISMERCNRISVAIQALQTAVAQHPNFMMAYELLAEIFDQRLQDTLQADYYRSCQQAAAERLQSIRSSNTEKTAEVKNPRIERVDLSVAQHRFDDLPLDRSITVVSGLPRSGTSMMMQMLQAGGMPLFTDQKRNADESNPEGYFETEKARQIVQDNRWLAESVGKVVKIVAPLLSHLDPKYQYRVIYLGRNLGEVSKSQFRMLDRCGKKGADRTEDELKQILQRQDNAARSLIVQHRQIASLFISHREAIRTPKIIAGQLRSFLDPHDQFDLNLDAMAAAVRPELHRERNPVSD